LKDILDNLPAHRGAAARDAVVAVGARLVSLPPYSPDFDPIDNIFSKMKAWIRRAAPRTVEALRDAVCIKAKLGEVMIERELLRERIAANPFHGEGHRKVWARLRVAGVRTTRRRTLRLMPENDLLAPSRTGAPKGPRNHDGTIILDALDIVCGTDMMSTWTQEGQSAVFAAVDHHSGECAGIHAARRGTRFEALEPIRQGVRQCFGALSEKMAAGLSPRHDHGSQCMYDDFQNEIRFLGIESSPAFVRAPEGNGCAERFIRTLMENLL